jgi:hypothetical protein
LEEADEARVGAVDQGLLVWLVEVLPVARSRKILGIVTLAQTSSNRGQAEVVVGILQST